MNDSDTHSTERAGKAPQHTPGPWRAGRTIDGSDIAVWCPQLSADGYKGGPMVQKPWVRIDSETIGVAIAVGDNAAEAKANAKFIVRACNSHADLLAALRRTQNILSDYVGHRDVEMCAAAECLEDVSAAIARAEGGSK